jgi:hypothetical protein
MVDQVVEQQDQLVQQEQEHQVKEIPEELMLQILPQQQQEQEVVDLEQQDLILHLQEAEQEEQELLLQ